MSSRFRKTLAGFLDRRTPGYLIFFVTPFCDCRCRMCFNRKTIDAAATRKILSLEEIEKIARNFYHLHHVNFSGGEPFLRSDFAQIPELFYRHSGTRFFACPTNSSQPDRIVNAVEKICASCPDAWIRITQSLDGIGADHDEIRGKTGLFEKVVELNQRLERLRQSHVNLSVGVAMVMSAFNQGKENAILDYACEHLSFADFGVLYARGDTWDAEATRINNEVYKNFIHRCRQQMKELSPNKSMTGRLFTAINMTASNLLMESIVKDCYVTPCRAGKNMVIMDDEGTITPCEILEHYINIGKARLDTSVFGNIRDYDYDITKVLDTDHARDVVHYIEDGRCYCSFECAMSVNVLYTPGLWTQVAKHFFRQ